MTESVVPGYEGIVQPSGFLVPGKTKGQLQLYNMNAAIPSETEINIASSDASLQKSSKHLSELESNFIIDFMFED